MAISLKAKISTIFKLLTEPKVLKFLISQKHSGYLLEKGWFKTYKLNSAVDINNQPIPWMTYSFIDFIDKKLNKNLILFEFGSGNSTLYFSNKVKTLITIEHNRLWYENIKKLLPNNVTILFSDIEEVYEKFLLNCEYKFDIIIVDSIRRNECLIESVKALSPSGVIFLDDSERKEYKKGVDHLINAGFKALNFWGIAPGTFFNKCTTIFYRKDNCLDI